MTLTEAQSRFDAYARAFAANDVERIADMWSFPCLISQQTGDFLFRDRASFVKNTTGLQGFYDRQGVNAAGARSCGACGGGRGVALAPNAAGSPSWGACGGGAPLLRRCPAPAQVPAHAHRHPPHAGPAPVATSCG